MLKKILRCLPIVAAVCFAAGCGASSGGPVTRSAGSQVSSTATSGSAPVTSSAVSSAVATTTSEPLSATDSVGYSVALAARLLDAGSVPAGFEAARATNLLTDAGDQASALAKPCSASPAVLTAVKLAGTPSQMAAAVLSSDKTDPRWVGDEVLRAYPTEDGAKKALADLRMLISHCPEVEEPVAGDQVWHLSVTAGPRLGDDSVHVDCSMSSGFNVLCGHAILIRTGACLVETQSQSLGDLGAGGLDRLAGAALRKFQAGGPCA